MPANTLARVAYAELHGVGNPVREWQEFTGRAYHLRRRLTKYEQSFVGEAVDCRQTDEAIRRFNAAKDWLPAKAVEFALQELGAEVAP